MSVVDLKVDFRTCVSHTGLIVIQVVGKRKVRPNNTFGAIL